MRFFLYGTLRRGQANHHRLAGARLLGQARTSPGYRLFDLGDYPGLVELGHTAVLGDLVELDPGHLPALDELEGHPWLYQRRPIRLEDGSSAVAWVLPSPAVGGVPEILSGDWAEAAPRPAAPRWLDAGHPIAARYLTCLRSAPLADLAALLDEHAWLVRSRLVTWWGSSRGVRSPLHVVTDWPPGVPQGGQRVALLAARGAELDAPFLGSHAETPLHWAASSGDLDLVEALVAAGAPLESPGSVIDGGAPLSNAVAFGFWSVARRLLELGAKATAEQAEALAGPLGKL